MYLFALGVIYYCHISSTFQTLYWDNFYNILAFTRYIPMLVYSLLPSGTTFMYFFYNLVSSYVSMVVCNFHVCYAVSNLP